MDDQISVFDKAKSFFFKSRRVWHVLKKPTKLEFWTVVKVSALGIAVLGVLGFLIAWAMGFFF